jgi:methylenetetrahydrofolate--tRNA-(uracil-5-)-methyltransferase
MHFPQDGTINGYMSTQPDLTVIGGGLAGSEAAWQAAELGLKIHLYEMRPSVATGAHQTPFLAELVCSNSLGSILPDRASGLLKDELRRLGSLLLKCADVCCLPAGSALAVDRDAFAQLVTQQIMAHPGIEVHRQEITEIPSRPAIIASGPLTSPALAKAIAAITGKGYLYFFDAIAPIIAQESIDMSKAFRASRYGKGVQGDGDYINCPLDQDQYEIFEHELLAAQTIPLRDFESEIKEGVKAGSGSFFEGCLPIEIIAQRGSNALAFGPMRPVGITNPHDGSHPRAVLQLRQDNFAGSLYNMVGFQTNLTFSEQRRIFRRIPGLESAEFLRFGQMHRNTYIASPELLLPTLQLSSRPDLFFAGQITGVEGYMGNIATGLLAGLNAARLIQGTGLMTFPPDTMIGALCQYISAANIKDFQPMKANFGILPPLKEPNKITAKGKIRPLDRRERAKLLVDRAHESIDSYLGNLG